MVNHDKNTEVSYQHNLAQHFGSADFISYDNNCKFALQDDITEHKLLASPLSKILLNTLGIF